MATTRPLPRFDPTNPANYAAATGYTPGDLGYKYGQPFGDPRGFTSSTQGSEIDRFNQWLRSQPWDQQFIAQTQNKGKGDLTPTEEAELQKLMQREGVPVAEGQVEVDKAGNIHQKSWRERHPLATDALIAAGMAAGGYFAAPALAGYLGSTGAGAVLGAGAGAAQGGLRAGGSWGGALKGAGLGAVTGAAGGALAGALPHGGGTLGAIGRSAARGGVGSAIRGQNPLMGAAVGGATGAVPSGTNFATNIGSNIARNAIASGMRGRNPFQTLPNSGIANIEQLLLRRGLNG